MVILIRIRIGNYDQLKRRLLNEYPHFVVKGSATFRPHLFSAQPTLLFAFSIRISDNISDGHLSLPGRLHCWPCRRPGESYLLLFRCDDCPPLNGSTDPSIQWLHCNVVFNQTMVTFFIAKKWEKHSIDGHAATNHCSMEDRVTSEKDHWWNPRTFTGVFSGHVTQEMFLLRCYFGGCVCQQSQSKQIKKARWGRREEEEWNWLQSID